MSVTILRLPLSCAHFCAHSPWPPSCTSSLLLSLLFPCSLPRHCHILETNWVTQHSHWRKGIRLDPDNIPGEPRVWSKSNRGSPVTPGYLTSLFAFGSSKNCFFFFSPFCTVPFLHPLVCFRQEQNMPTALQGPSLKFPEWNHIFCLAPNEELNWMRN